MELRLVVTAVFVVWLGGTLWAAVKTTRRIAAWSQADPLALCPACQDARRIVTAKLTAEPSRAERVLAVAEDSAVWILEPLVPGIRNSIGVGTREPCQGSPCPAAR